MLAPLLLWLAAAGAAPPRDGLVAGRLAIYEGRALAPLRRVQDVIRQPVSLSLRRGRKVYDAALDEDGFFVIRVPAGVYRLESVGLGTRAEVIDPQQVEVRASQLLCAGTLAVSVQRLEYLGQSTLSRFDVFNDCAQLWPVLKQRAGWAGPTAIRLPRPAAFDEAPRALGAADLLCGLRAEASVSGTELALRGWYVYPLLSGLGDAGAVTVHLSAARLTRWMDPSPNFGGEVTLGPGVNVLGLLELIGVAGVRIGFEGFTTEPVLAFIVRPGSYGAAIDLRAQWTPSGPMVSVGVDLAPFFLLGSLL
ncbi:MAG TPA: hypothetical protein VIG99_20310 [Myxococcaceae bacterium]